MELQCAESLGVDVVHTLPLPDSSSTQPKQFQHSTHPQPTFRKRPSTSNSIRHEFSTTSLQHQLSHSHPVLSPVTRSPSPSPKRARLQSHSCNQQHIYSSSSSSSSSTVKPNSYSISSLFKHTHQSLQILCERDVDHALRQRNHLQNTPVTPSMREQVVGWCTDLTEDLKLPAAIAAVTVNLFDRFLNIRSVSTRVLHPLTAACFLIACKSVSDEIPYLDIIANRARVSINDMLAVEPIILNLLNWRISVVTPHEVIALLEQALLEDNITDILTHNNQTNPISSLSSITTSTTTSTTTTTPCQNTSKQDFETNNDNDSDSSSIDGSGSSMHEALLLHALTDYRMAYMRATSVGVACMLVAEAAKLGRNLEDLYCIQTLPLYEIAVDCDIDMDQVHSCAECLLGVVSNLFDDVEDVDSEES